VRDGLIFLASGLALLCARLAFADTMQDCEKWMAMLEGKAASMPIRGEQPNERRVLLASIDNGRTAAQAGRLDEAATKIREFRAGSRALTAKKRLTGEDDQTLMMLTGTVLQCLGRVEKPPH
jgi:hypothetical protein